VHDELCCYRGKRETVKHNYWSGCSGVVVEYRTRNREVAALAGSHSCGPLQATEQVANLQCAQANSASYPQRDGK